MLFTDCPIEAELPESMEVDRGKYNFRLLACLLLIYTCRNLNMLPDEKAIIEYLKGWPHTFVSGKEIARKVGGRDRYEEDRGWAVSVLVEMSRKGFIESDHLGYFRLTRQDDSERKRFTTRHVAPQILKILKSSGQSFEGYVLDDEDEDGNQEQNRDKK